MTIASSAFYTNSKPSGAARWARTASSCARSLRHVAILRARADAATETPHGGSVALPRCCVRRGGRSAIFAKSVSSPAGTAYL